VVGRPAAQPPLAGVRRRQEPLHQAGEPQREPETETSTISSPWWASLEVLEYAI